MGVDRLEARLLDREPQQAPAGPHDGRRRFRPHVALGKEPETIRRQRLHLLDAGNGGQALRKPLTEGLHIHAESAAKHLPAQFRHRTHQNDVALVEQRNAIADRLHTFEEMG